MPDERCSDSPSGVEVDETGNAGEVVGYQIDKVFGERYQDSQRTLDVVPIDNDIFVM